MYMYMNMYMYIYICIVPHTSPTILAWSASKPPSASSASALSDQRTGRASSLRGLLLRLLWSQTYVKNTRSETNLSPFHLESGK